MLNESYFVLFLIVACGMAVGRIRLFGFSLDVSAVIFVALLLGHWGASVPDGIQQIGLVLFIYTVGLQAGPGFFESLKTHGRKLAIVALSIVGSGAVAGALVSRTLGIDMEMASGLFAGALTSTPGLAAATESSNSPLASVGYGVAYPFGVLGVVLVVRLLPKILGVDLAREEELYRAESLSKTPALLNENLRVENRSIDGKTLADLRMRSSIGVNISRVLHNGVAAAPKANTALKLGDIVKVVGTRAALDQARLLIGPPASEEIPPSPGYEVLWLLVTNKSIANSTLREIALWPLHNATVTRIRRSGIDLPPRAESRIQLGDKLMVACGKEDLPQVMRLLGNDEKRLADADFLPVAVGIVAGVLLGQLKFMAGSFTLALGVTGGVLSAGLILSRLGKTGPVVWNLSGSSPQVLRQLGLLFFLAAVGTTSGAHLAETLQGDWPRLVGAGAVMTLFPMVVGVLVGHFWLRMNFFTLTGVLTGSMTSTPGLAAAGSIADNDAPAIAYATVYPIALVTMIVACHFIANF